MEVVPNKTRVIFGTEAMNTGVSIDNLEYFLYREIPPILYMHMQTMGHIGHTLNAESGFNAFEMHLYFDSMVTMFICIKQGTSADERTTQLVSSFELLEFHVVPVEYYHSFLEYHFEVM